MILGRELDVELESLGDSGVSLMDGERLDTALDLKTGMVQRPTSGASLLLLTNKRLILLNANGGRRNSAFASLQGVNAIEVVVDQRGIASYVWAVMALVVAGLLWGLIDHPVGSIAAAVALGLMGVYLVIDRLMDPHQSLLRFKVGSSEFQCELSGPEATSHVYPFVNRVFELKDGDQRLPSSSHRSEGSIWL